MSKHTPGPWLAIRCLDGYRVNVPPGHMTADCLGETHTEANARLIAAAPEMKDALVRAFHWIHTPGAEMNNGWTAERLMDEIKTILAKTEGGK